MDLSLMAKYLVQGNDAEKALNRICANNVAVPDGACVYTQWLNSRGGIEADLTVTRLARDCFRVVVSDALHHKAHAWLKRHIPSDAHAFVTDITPAYTLISLQGPKSRELLASLTTSADLSNEAMPYLSARSMDIGYALLDAVRVSYVGELGYELYVPADFAMHVYDRLMEAGKDFGLKLAGGQALHSLRIEKAYRDWGHDLDNTDTPLEAGLGFAVDFNKPGGFMGKEALLAQKEGGPLKKRLVQFLLQDPEPLLLHGEMIYRNGEIVGHLRSGEYGHTLGGAVGLGYVEHEGGVTLDYIQSGDFEIQVAGKRYRPRYP